MHAGSGLHQDVRCSLPFPWFHVHLHRLSSKIYAEVLKCCNISCVMRQDSVNHQVQSHIPSVNVLVLPINMTLIDVQCDKSGKPCCKAIPNVIPMCSKTQLHVPSKGLSKGLYILIWVGMDVSLNQQAPCQSHNDPNWLVTFFITGHWTYLSFWPIFPYRDPLPLLYADYIGLPCSFFLIHYHPNLWPTLVLSSGTLLIFLSVSVLLSCTMHRLTKQWYCRPWTMSPSPYCFTHSSPPAVYKMYHYSTWTLSLSFRTIKTSEPESWKSCISRSTSQSHSSLQLHRHGTSQSVHHRFCPE